MIGATLILALSYSNIHSNIVFTATPRLYVDVLLPGMSRFADSSSSPLALLDQGAETSVVYRKLLAELLGVPTGNELRQLRQVSAVIGNRNE